MWKITKQIKKKDIQYFQLVEHTSMTFHTLMRNTLQQHTTTSHFTHTHTSTHTQNHRKERETKRTGFTIHIQPLPTRPPECGIIRRPLERIATMTAIFVPCHNSLRFSILSCCLKRAPSLCLSTLKISTISSFWDWFLVALKYFSKILYSSLCEWIKWIMTNK